MAAGQKRNTALVPQAYQALERFKYEVANEIAHGADPQAHTLQSWYQSGYGGDIPARVWGSVGGNMVRRMIAAAEQALVQQTAGQIRAGFQQGLQGQPGQQFPSQFTGTTPNPQQVNIPPAN